MKDLKTLLSALILIMIVAAVCVCGCLTTENPNPASPVSPDAAKMKSFSSEKELQDYLEKANDESIRPATGSYLKSAVANFAVEETEASAEAPMRAPVPAAEPAETVAATSYSDSSIEYGSGVDRYSGTNTRTKLVDEADIVKTDGNFIYYKSDNYYYITDNDGKYKDERKTYIISALPPEEAEIVSSIDDDMYVSGIYLLNDSVIMVGSNELKCYDVKNKERPSLRWAVDTDGYYENSRLVGDTLYLVTENWNTRYPIMYMEKNIAADRVFAPEVPAGFTTNLANTHCLSKIDLKDGTVKDTVAILGNWDFTLYMSSENIYFVNHYTPDEQEASMDFLLNHGSDYYPAEVMDKIRRVLENEDFGERAKYIEVDETIENYLMTLSEKKAEEIAERADEDFSKYYSGIVLEKEFSLITRINADTFEVTTGTMPGKLLNDYSIDENDGNLRTASTIGNTWRTRNDSINAVSVFDKNMERIGFLSGIAKGERIYSANFAGDKLFLVTFKETDPFFVIDLSAPEKPEVLGELKIPGYSSYLRPIGNDLVIGIGMINGSSKVSLFDVSDLSNPKEIDSYTFEEYTSVLYDFHAFLWDAEREILVLPAGRHAYVFSVGEKGIDLVKDDEHGDKDNYDYVKRSLYINNYLYTVASNSIHIINMDTWETVNEVEIPPSVYPDWNDYYEYYEEPVEPIYYIE